jgi:hypothetical protein
MVLAAADVASSETLAQNLHRIRITTPGTPRSKIGTGSMAGNIAAARSFRPHERSRA